MQPLINKNIAYNVGDFQYCQLESSKMTLRASMSDNPRMDFTSDEIIKAFENGRSQMGWSKREMAQKSHVPYSWVVDLYRNKPQKPDMKRVQQVLAALGFTKPSEKYEQQIMEKFGRLEEQEKQMFMHMLDSFVFKKSPRKDV